MAAFLDACRFTPTAGGTTDWTYSSAVTGYQSPAAANVVNGRLYKYRAENATLTEWEIGEGAYSTGTGVLARTTVLFNSLGTTAKINFSAAPQVAVVALKEDLISIEESNAFTSAQQTQARDNIGAVLKGHLFGLTMSTAGSSATMTIAAGEAADSTGVRKMALGSAIGKTTSAWAVGTAAGGLDTGSIAANTGYYFYLIMRVDTGVVDVVFSTSVSAPTLPTNYTLYRNIGWGKTDGSSQWKLFTQVGDDFIWSVAVQDVNVSNFSTTATLYTLASVPSGKKVQARVRIDGFAGAGGLSALFTSPDEASGAANSPAGNVNMSSSAASTPPGGGDLLVRTNTSAQIRGVALSGTTNTLLIVTVGWTDTRGRLE